MIKKNKTEILSFFKFPLEDTSVSLFKVDSLFDAKRKLRGGTNSNNDYRKTRPDVEEVCAEYAVSWVFKSDGEKFKFFTHRIAD